MEKTVATPYWTGMTLFSLTRRGGRRHLMHDAMFQLQHGRVAFKGQVFSAPMDWASVQHQLEAADKQETLISLPVTGAVLAARVQIQISAGLIDLNKLIKQATVRRNVVVQLIRMHRDAGHPDYQRFDMEEVRLKARELASSDQPTVPHGLAEILEEGMGGEEKAPEVDKAATPAERVWDESALRREMDRKRPHIMMPQRDSDAKKDVAAGRTSALNVFSQLSLRTGSELIDQFQGNYIPRVFNLTLPWCVGGPDFPGRQRVRRASANAPSVNLEAFTEMMARRVEAQVRWDWDFNPAVWSLCFATKVNLGVSLAAQRALRQGEVEECDDRSIGVAAAKLYKLLQTGEYVTPCGRRVPVKGDLAKAMQIVGLSSKQKALLKNYQFMSARIAGTRQIRRSINHLVFSARVFYGLPVFMTVTPSERHSGLMIRLTRYRRSDPAVTCGKPEFLPWVGYDAPSLQTREGDIESETIELPEYDLRREMTARDPLCCSSAFRVAITVLVASLFGLRMCPDCPHCATSECPCMDSFGSNGTPMGGSSGRADALIGAEEAQKAEGVLHFHFFIFLQMAHQFMTLVEIASMLERGILSVDALKRFHDHVRHAAYPKPEDVKEERPLVEEMWPAYQGDVSLCRAPPFVWQPVHAQAPPTLSEAVDHAMWETDGARWKRLYEDRLQHALSRMNHHIHPVVDASTGERRPLRSCQPKNRPKECKGGFPLTSELTDRALLVCPCIAEERGLPQSGPRSRIGTILPERNDEWLNAGSPAWAVFMADNGDVKLLHRMPILPGTHEVLLYDVRRCCGRASALELAYQVQASQSLAAGYFGGYSAKMQEIGHKELERMEASLCRKLEVEAPRTEAKAFQEYSRRLVRDLEGKGILRTAVECINLSSYANHPDIMMAECIRTFPSVRFDAVQLLRREEVETGASTGISIIAAVHSSGGFRKRAYLQAPFDLMYGFRGGAHNVDLLSPYEMLMYWSMEAVRPPSTARQQNNAVFTEAGLRYRKECVLAKVPPDYTPGLHYIAEEGEDRILLPSIAVLGTLRHRWLWSKRPRLHVPTWSYAKVPRSSLAPEENARLLSVYMRPWTLSPSDESEHVPLLSRMAEYAPSAGADASGRVGVATSPAKRRRLAGKQPSEAEPKAMPRTGRRSYAETWQHYVDGNVVSESSRRFIINLLAATAARVVVRAEDSSSESEGSDIDRPQGHAGNLELVRNTLKGIAAHDEEEGQRGFGRNAASIRMGRSLWESPALSERERKSVAEHIFLNDGEYPTTKDALKAASETIRLDDARQHPFAGSTLPFAFLTVREYGQKLTKWLSAVQDEEDPPTAEQMRVLRRVADRILTEFALEKEGEDVPAELRAGRGDDEMEEPLRGLVHGPPGTGKSAVINWLCRMLSEALQWERGKQFLCLAFQNKMAAAIGGTTLHSGGDLPLPGQFESQRLSHSDVDNLYMRNQDIRWLFLDEVSMVADGLLGTFESNIRGAARKTRYSKRRDKSQRPFGGYNLLTFGDWWQLPPIPDSAGLFNPPGDRTKSGARAALGPMAETV